MAPTATEKSKTMATRVTRATRATGKKTSKAKKTLAARATGEKISKAKKMVALRSGDGKEFEVELAVALQFKAIQSLFDETLFRDQTLTPVPLPNVDGETLDMVIEYCTKHAEAEAKKRKNNKALQAWDAKFVNVDQSVLHDLLMAAHYLGINELVNLCCETVANTIAGKSPAEIRAFFHIEDDISEMEKEEIRREERSYRNFVDVESVSE